MSDWKRGAAERRDERADRGTAEVPRQTSRRKDTKRWCGGHVGREHTPKCFEHVKGFINVPGWYDLQCTTCGRVIDRWWPMRFVDDGPMPAWVVK